MGGGDGVYDAFELDDGDLGLERGDGRERGREERRSQEHPHA
jgi:hypothetical protein